MARDYYINGQCMVFYNDSELGLTDGNGKVTVTPSPKYLPIEVDGWFQCPPERQQILMDATISMTLVHFDIDVINSAMNFSVGGSQAGTLPTGGRLIGEASGYNELRLSSPALSTVWRFPSCYIKDSYELPLGAERSLLRITWHAIGYNADPYNTNGTGSQGTVIYTNT